MPIVVRDCDGMSTEEVRKRVKATGKHVLLKFSSKNCGPCEDLSHKLSSYKTDLQLEIFEICRTETTSFEDLWDEFDITSFPTVVLVDEDMKEVHGGGSEQEPPSRTRGSNIEKFKALVEGNRHMFK